jgi:hypothetical protein
MKYNKNKINIKFKCIKYKDLVLDKDKDLVLDKDKDKNIIKNKNMYKNRSHNKFLILLV